jgi:hypothetical protein
MCLYRVEKYEKNKQKTVLAYLALAGEEEGDRSRNKTA